MRNGDCGLCVSSLGRLAHASGWSLLNSTTQAVVGVIGLGQARLMSRSLLGPTNTPKTSTAVYPQTWIHGELY